MAKKFSIGPQPQILRLYGFDKPMSRSPVNLPFPGAMGVDTPQGMTPNPVSQMYSQLLQFEEERALLYALYDEMELDPTIYGYLEQLSEDATQRDARRNVCVWCESSNKNVERIVNSMLAQTGLSDELTQPIIREIAKYGEDFEFVLAEPQEGVVRLIHYHPATVSRIHDEYGRMRGFTPYQPEEFQSYGLRSMKTKNTEMLSLPHDFLHFRRLGRSVTRIYGTSVLFGARRIWRQVQMMEDKIALSRLLRNVDRYKHLIDVTGMGPVDADAKVDKYRRSVKRDFSFDPNSMDFASVYALIAENEDLFIQTRENDNSDIQVLAGTKGLDDLRDLEMFLDRMFGALRAPKGYFGFEGNANFERSPSQQDIRFARQAGALQHIFLTEATRLAMIDMMYRGVDPLLEENSFTLFMVPPSALEELYRLETLEARVRSLETLARVGNTVGVDQSTWLEVVLSEFPIFTQAFTEVVIDALRRLRASGVPDQEIAQEVFRDKKVVQAINEERKDTRVDWKVSSKDPGVRIPNDLASMVREDTRDVKTRVEQNEKFMEAAEKARKEAAQRQESAKTEGRKNDDEENRTTSKAPV